MKIRIVSVDPDGQLLAESEYGNFEVYWGDEGLPVCGKEYNVEMDVPHRYSLSEVSISGGSRGSALTGHGFVWSAEQRLMMRTVCFFCA